jgi:hypothetical protein
MGFINDASKEICGAQGVTVVGPAKAELSFRPELHAMTPCEAVRRTPKAKAVDPAPADASRPSSLGGPKAYRRPGGMDHGGGQEHARA